MDVYIYDCDRLAGILGMYIIYYIIRSTTGQVGLMHFCCKEKCQDAKTNIGY